METEKAQRHVKALQCTYVGKRTRSHLILPNINRFFNFSTDWDDMTNGRKQNPDGPTQHERQQDLKLLLHVGHSLLKSLGIRNWYMGGGTLYSTLIYGRFFPWESDIDAHITYDEYKKLETYQSTLSSQREITIDVNHGHCRMAPLPSDSHVWLSICPDSRNPFKAFIILPVSGVLWEFSVIYPLLRDGLVHYDSAAFENDYTWCAAACGLSLSYCHSHELPTMLEEMLFPATLGTLDDVPVQLPRSIKDFLQHNAETSPSKVNPGPFLEGADGHGYVDMLGRNYDQCAEVNIRCVGSKTEQVQSVSSKAFAKPHPRVDGSDITSSMAQATHDYFEMLDGFQVRAISPMDSGFSGCQIVKSEQPSTLNDIRNSGWKVQVSYFG